MGGHFHRPDGTGSGPAGLKARRPGRPPSFGFCTVCGEKVSRARAVRRYPGAFLCPGCGKDDEYTFRAPRRVAARRAALPVPPPMDVDGMVRKNLTITMREDEFLQTHREINQSALFRRAIVSLMQAEEDELRRTRRMRSR